MLEYVQNLFETAGFLPYGYCYFWQPTILIANVIGDGLIALALFSIAPMLYYIINKRKDVSQKNVFVWFGIFILLCSVLHLLAILTVWVPVYRLYGLLKVITGLVSLYAAVVLYRSVPHLLKIPGFRHLEHVNKRLRSEVAERERAQVALREANEALEARVQQRTAQLIQTNRKLETEIEQRIKTEKELTSKNKELLRLNDELQHTIRLSNLDSRQS